MKVLIIEDEEPAALELHRLLNQQEGKYEVVALLASNKEISEWSKSNPWPDLILSDIELLDGPIFQTYKSLRPTSPIIFTTAYDQYMADAFETNGIAYLLKPFNEFQLSEALRKHKLLRLDISVESLDNLIDNFKDLTNGKKFKNRFTIKKGSSMYFLPVKDIACMKMGSGVIQLHDADGKYHLLSMTLTQCYSYLDPSNFFLINRSEGVSLSYIERFEMYGKDRLAVYITGQSKPLISSIGKTPSFRRWLEEEYEI